MLAIPFDHFEVFDTRLFLRTPKLNRPRKHAAMFVGPFIERTRDALLRIIFEAMICRQVRIPGDLGPLRADLFERPHILGGLLVVWLVTEAAQQHTAHCMERNRAGNVRMPADKLNEITSLRLADGMWSSA